MVFKNVFESWLKEKVFYDLNDLTLLPKSTSCEQFEIPSEMINKLVTVSVLEMRQPL